jgi:hypothetical protein
VHVQKEKNVKVKNTNFTMREIKKNEYSGVACKVNWQKSKWKSYICVEDDEN